MSEQENAAIGHAKATVDDPKDVWDLVDEALFDCADEDGDLPKRYPADVEVTIRVD